MNAFFLYTYHHRFGLDLNLYLKEKRYNFDLMLFAYKYRFLKKRMNDPGLL